MPIQFIFNLTQKNVTLESSLGLNILGHAQIEECEIGSRCGGHGVCGGDKVRIMKGHESLSEVTEKEMKHLNTKEIKNHYRLGCQAFLNDPDAEVIVEV
jgi:Na+-transporting NADH:ubiquinone oxidoreductase subunit F